MRLVIRLFFSLILLAIGLFFSRDVFGFELKLYETFLTSYYFSGFFARVLVSLYFVIATFWIFGNKTKLITFFSFPLLYLPIHFWVYDYLVSSPIILFPIDTFLPSFLVLTLTLVGIALLFWVIKSHPKPFFHSLPLRIVGYVVSILLVVFVFVSNPLFIDEFQNLTEENFSDNTEIYDSLDRSYPTELAAFFSTKCKYCELASKRLALLSERFDNFPPVKIHFVGDHEKVKWFWNKSGTKLNYDIIEPEYFLNITHGSYPKFIYFEDSKPVYFYSGRTFNYATPSNLISSGNKL